MDGLSRNWTWKLHRHRALKGKAGPTISVDSFTIYLPYVLFFSGRFFQELCCFIFEHVSCTFLFFSPRIYCTFEASMQGHDHMNPSGP